jgi:hypothetical protein
MKKFYISKAFSFYLFLKIFIGPSYLFFDKRVIGTPFSNKHIYGIISFIFLVCLSAKKYSKRNFGRYSSFLPFVSYDS